MRTLEGDRVVMRIYISESDRHHRQPIYHEILDLLKSRKIAGATVFRGIAGFGADSNIHSSDILSISKNLPIIIEVVDSDENISRIRPLIEDFLESGLITLQKVHVAKFTSSKT